MAVVLDRATLTARGPDAAEYLQSMLSNDVSEAAPGGAVYALLLTPKARVIADLELFNTGDELVLASDPSRRDDVLATLVRSRFRRKVELEPSGACRRLGRRRRCAGDAGHADRPLPADRRAAGRSRRRGGLGDGPHRGRHPALRSRVRRRHDACGGRAGRARGQLQQGLLPGAGAGRPPALPRPSEPRGARARVFWRGAARGRGGGRLRREAGRTSHLARRVADDTDRSRSPCCGARCRMAPRSMPAVLPEL